MNTLAKRSLVADFAQLRDSIIAKTDASGTTELTLVDIAPKWITDLIVPYMIEADEQECFSHQVTTRTLDCLQRCATVIARLDPNKDTWDKNLIDFVSEAVPELSQKELTEWLNEAEENLIWLTQAIEHEWLGRSKGDRLPEGHELLRSAHRIWFVAIGNEFVSTAAEIVVASHNN